MTVEVINAAEFRTPEGVADIVWGGVRRFPVMIVGPGSGSGFLIRSGSEAEAFRAGVLFGLQRAWLGIEKLEPETTVIYHGSVLREMIPAKEKGESSE